MNLALDIGNTRVKAAVFKTNNLIELFVFNKSKLISKVKQINKKHAITCGIVSNVAAVSEKKMQQLQQHLPLIILNNTTKIPFTNCYKTPKTLGVDRLALVAGALQNYPNKNTLVIDAGTCITYDFLTEKGNYIGGAISPGIDMRFKALHNFTANLPLIEDYKPGNLVGGSTEESIISGVLNGVAKEIDGVIAAYKKENLHLTVVLTGGNIKILSKQLKSSIFVNQNLLLEGLNQLLKLNKDL